MAKKSVPRPRGLRCPSCGSTDIHSYGTRWYCVKCGRVITESEELIEFWKNNRG